MKLKLVTRANAVVGALLMILFSSSRATAAIATPAQIVTDGDRASCELVQAHKDLRIFKDPSLFLPMLALLYRDPATGWKELQRENPLLTTVRGPVYLMRLGGPTGFKNYGAIARFYEAIEPRLRMQPQEGGFTGPTPIVPVLLCGESDAYRNSMGFVIASDLRNVQQEDQREGGLPPSVYPNPIPKLPKGQ
jgi:hypothetical protein